VIFGLVLLYEWVTVQHCHGYKSFDCDSGGQNELTFVPALSFLLLCWQAKAVLQDKCQRGGEACCRGHRL